MILIPNEFGFTNQFETVEELNYNLLNALECSVRPDGTIMTPLAKQPLKFGDKVLIASIDPNNIHYPGEGQILFDPLNNLKMVISIFGLFMDKLRVFDEREILSWYPNEKVDENKIIYTSLSIKFADNSIVSSKYYINKTLPYIELMFQLAEEDVNLSNFDLTPEEFLARRNNK